MDYNAIYDEKCISHNLSQFAEWSNYAGYQFGSPCKGCCSLESCKNFYLAKFVPLMRQPIEYGVGVFRYHVMRKSNNSLPGKSPLDITRYVKKRGTPWM